MSVLIVSNDDEIGQASELRFLSQGFLDFNISSSIKNLGVWLSQSQVKVIFIALKNVDQLHIDKCINLINNQAKVFVFDPKGKLDSKPSYICLNDSEWDIALAQFHKNAEQKASRDSILVKINSKYTRVKIEDIEYLSSDGKFVNIAIKDKVLTTRNQLKNISKLLPNNFLTVHRSYILNTNKVNTIHLNDMQVEMENYKIPFSRKHKQELLSNFRLSS